jgi:hypothetical protein
MDREPLTAEYLQQCEYRARKFAGAYTGTSGTLAGMVLHLLAEVRRLNVQLAQAQEQVTYWQGKD